MFLRRAFGKILYAAPRSEASAAASTSYCTATRNPLEEFFEADRKPDDDKPVVYEIFIDMIWRAISNCGFSMLINGEVHGFFKSSRGLRQGDPLFPTLFIIGAEVLSRGLKQLMERSPAHAFSLPIGCPIISHLAYADDVMIFTRGTKRALDTVRKLLQQYEFCSGQSINVSKSSFIISPKVSAARKVLIQRWTGFSHSPLLTNYLGVPLYYGKKTAAIFAQLLAKLKAKLDGWSASCLSSGGRLTLIKHVLTSIPIYQIMTIQPPAHIIHKIETVLADFYWGWRENKKKLHWKAWKHICLPMNEGGLGCRRISDMSTAFAMKLWWNLRQGKSLWAQFMGTKYCKGQDPTIAQASMTNSHCWKRLIKVRDLMLENTLWFIGTGECNFWRDKWHHEILFDAEISISPKLKVKDLIQNQQWDTTKLQEFLDDPTIQKIREVPLAENQDISVWTPTYNGRFTVQSAWELIRHRHSNGLDFSWMWDKHIPLKMSIHMWKIFHHIVPVDSAIRLRGIPITSRCSCCITSGALESSNHLHSEGELATKVWQHFDKIFNIQPSSTNLSSRLEMWLLPQSGGAISFIRRTLPIIICWQIWKFRCKIRFEEASLDFGSVIYSSTRLLQDIMSSTSFTTPKQASLQPTLMALHITLPPVGSTQVIEVRWVRPTAPLCKLNTDGSSSGNTAEGGGIIRDFQGTMLKAFANKYNPCSSIESETNALLYGLQLCHSYGFLQLDVEIDSTVLVDALSSTHPPWRIRPQIRKIKQGMQSFHSISIKHVYREANSVADSLAKWGASNHNCIFLAIEELPETSAECMQQDRTSVYTRSLAK